MNRITHILLFLLLLFGSSFETIDMVTYKGPLKSADSKHQSNKGDHQDIAIDDVIILKYRNLSVKAEASKKHAAFYRSFFGEQMLLDQSFLYGFVSDKSQQLPGFGHLHRYHIY